SGCFTFALVVSVFFIIALLSPRGVSRADNAHPLLVSYADPPSRHCVNGPTKISTCLFSITYHTNPLATRNSASTLKSGKQICVQNGSPKRPASSTAQSTGAPRLPQAAPLHR